MAAALKLHAAQMRFPLRRPAAADRGSFVLGDSNRAAAEALDAWPDASAPVLAVVGPAGAGKSHLGAVWAQRTGAASLKGAEAALADLPALEARPVFLDEADQADDETLFHLINLAHASGGALLLVHQAARRDADLLELFGRRQAIGGQDPDPLANLALQAGDPGHEELVEVVGRDRQDPQPLQQRVRRVRGLLEHPAVELQPGNLAIEKSRRRGQQVLRQAQLRRAGGGDPFARGGVADRRVAHA